jgi:hypothetical protein
MYDAIKKDHKDLIACEKWAILCYSMQYYDEINISVDSEVYLKMLSRRGGLLDKLKKDHPYLKDQEIIIQHDETTAHNGKGNEVALNAWGKRDGWNISFETQPSQSPDLNKLDLCFFNSLLRLTNRLKANNKTTEKLLEAVIEAYDIYDTSVLERIEGIQHEIYRCILKDDGGNQFDMPHSGVRDRQKNGADPCDRTVSPKLVMSARIACSTFEDILKRL